MSLLVSICPVVSCSILYVCVCVLGLGLGLGLVFMIYARPSFKTAWQSLCYASFNLVNKCRPSRDDGKDEDEPPAYGSGWLPLGAICFNTFTHYRTHSHTGQRTGLVGAQPWGTFTPRDTLVSCAITHPLSHRQSQIKSETMQGLRKMINQLSAKLMRSYRGRFH